MKICTRCNEKKPLTEFSNRPDCKTCRNAYSKERAKRLGTMELTTRRHGANAALYTEILAIQGERCPLCGDPPDPKARAMPIDHDHQTERLRGILCARCNGGLGMFRDDPDVLRRAANYLEFWAKGWGLFEAAYQETYGQVDPAE